MAQLMVCWMSTQGKMIWPNMPPSIPTTIRVSCSIGRLIAVIRFKGVMALPSPLMLRKTLLSTCSMKTCVVQFLSHTGMTLKTLVLRGWGKAVCDLNVIPILVMFSMNASFTEGMIWLWPDNPFVSNIFLCQFTPRS